MDTARSSSDDQVTSVVTGSIGAGDSRWVTTQSAHVAVRRIAQVSQEMTKEVDIPAS
jgi:hypothetical protein